MKEFFKETQTKRISLVSSCLLLEFLHVITVRRAWRCTYAAEHLFNVRSLRTQEKDLLQERPTKTSFLLFYIQGPISWFLFAIGQTPDYR